MAIDGLRADTWEPNQLWPRQDQPTPFQRRLWKRYLRSSYLRYIPYWKRPPLQTKPQTPTQSEPILYPLTTSQTIHDYVRSLPKSQRRLLAELQQQATDRQVWRAFRSKAKLYIASDGGLDGNLGTHGWVLASKKHVLFRCSGPVDGDTATSTRSELAGCVSSLLIIHAIARMWGIRHRCSFYWLTDSRSAISRIQRNARRTSSKATKMPNDADLISLARTLLSEIRRPFTPVWIKGHQDSLQSYEQLPFQARLNIDADFLATRYRKRGRLRSSKYSDHQYGQQVSILINGVRITGQFDTNIRFHVNGYHLRQYMQTKHAWNDSTWNNIDFHLFGQHFKRLRPNHQVTHMKRVHGQLPLGVRRYQQARVKAPALKLCPCCKNHDESADHLLRCTHNPVFASSVRQLRKDIITEDSHPVRYLIAEGLEHWLYSKHFTPRTDQYPEFLQEPIRAALLAQQSIGWEEALSGFLSKNWGHVATRDMYNEKEMDKSKGQERIRGCISAIYAHTHRMWISRNEALHSNDEDQLRDIRSTENAEIRDLHQKPHLLRAGDRHYCERSLEKLLKGPQSTRRRWLRRVRKSMEEHRSDGGQQALITSYLQQYT